MADEWFRNSDLAGERTLFADLTGSISHTFELMGSERGG